MKARSRLSRSAEEHLDLFECFDGHWKENFGSAVLMMAFRSSESFRAELLGFVRSKARANVAAAEAAPNTYLSSREEGFEVASKHGARKGRFDVLLVSGARVIAIEHKTRLVTTKEQLAAQRKALERRYVHVLVCSLQQQPSAPAGEDVVLSWSNVSRMLRGIPVAERPAIGRSLLTAYADFFGGHDVEFSGFPKGDKAVLIHQQRAFLLEKLLAKLAQKVTSKHDNRNAESGEHWQSAGFKDVFGGTGRYLGFYEYAKGNRSELALYANDAESSRLAVIPWARLRKDLAVGTHGLEEAVQAISKDFARKLEAIAPKKAKKKV